MNDLTIYNKRGRMFGLMFLASVLVFLGFILIYFSMTTSAPFWFFIVGLIGVFFFGFAALYYLKELIIRKPALIVSEKGIIDRSSYLAAGLVEWKDIRNFEVVQFEGQLFLAIYTYETKLIINRSNGVKKLLNKMNRGLIASQVNIPVKNLAYSTEALSDEINKRWQH